MLQTCAISMHGFRLSCATDRCLSLSLRRQCAARDSNAFGDAPHLTAYLRHVLQSGPFCYSNAALDGTASSNRVQDTFDHLRDFVMRKLLQ